LFSKNEFDFTRSSTRHQLHDFTLFFFDLSAVLVCDNRASLFVGKICSQLVEKRLVFFWISLLLFVSVKHP